MAKDAIIILEKLRCITSAAEGRREPYIWPALLRIDDDTLMSAHKVAIVTGQDARHVIKDSMQAGETVAIPGSVGMLGTRFEDDLSILRLILVVVLLEEDETPESAIEAGFQAFSSELRAAVADNLFALSQASEEEERAIIETIKTRVNDRVTSAEEDQLSWWAKTKILGGKLTPDYMLGFASIDFGKEIPPTPRPITLAFEFIPRILGQPIGEVKFEIQGQFLIRPLPINQCQPQVDAVKAAEAVINMIEQEIRDLQAQLQGNGDDNGDEPPLPKSYINGEIRRLREEEIPPAEANLEKARRALQACRTFLRTGQVKPGDVATA